MSQHTSAVKSAQKEKNIRFHLPACPHCGKKINPFYAWSLKSKGEYHCNYCGSYSNIRLERFIYWAGLLSVVLAGILLLIFIFTGSNHPIILPLMFVPFVIFTGISPFFVRFEKIEFPKQRRKRPDVPVTSKTQQVSLPKREKGSGNDAFSLEKDATMQFQKQKQTGGKKDSFNL